MVASRPTPARGGGITTIHVWLIVFVALWLISTVLAVLLYTGREKLVLAAQDAKSEAEGLMKSNEASRFRVFKEQGGDRQSLARVLDNERVELAHLIGLDETTSAKAASDQVNKVIAALTEGAPKGAELPDLTGSDLLTVVKTLQAAWLAQTKAGADLNQRLAAAVLQMKGQTATQVQKAKGFEETLAQLDERLRKLEGDAEKTIDSKNKQVKDLEQKITKVQDAGDEKAVKLRRESRDKDKEISDLRAKWKDAQAQLTDFRTKVASLDLAKEADGKILRARSDEDMVYIDLGKADHLTLGLTFNVYSASTKPDDSGKGKATIEVVGIGDDISECRVINSNPADPIIAGDYIVNAIYSPDRKYRFAVEGQFDLDGDGRSDPQDVERIKAWIRAWGGEVVDLPKTPAPGADLGMETVDFLVLGASPPSPPPGQKGQLKPEERARRAELRRALDRFNAIKQEAKDLSIAVLTQSQFLHFIGQGGQQKSRSSAGGTGRTAMGQ
ncbi:MAG: hypothetical protein JXQ73_01245 [Phycisphaerae bacterium]|nr:hypothetical protein [Phycisphaerae bacterium]